MTGYLLNGRFVEGRDFVIQPHLPFFAHGQGLFETLRARKGRPMFLARHMDRMISTARLLELGDVPAVETIRRDIVDLVGRLGLSDARVKLHLLCRDDMVCDFLITADPVAPMVPLFPAVAAGQAAPIFAKGIAMAGLKTMNYMANRLAEREGRRRGLDEVVFSTVDGVVLEGTRTSIFSVIDGELRTAPLSLPILPGVIRAVLLELARGAAIPVAERAFTLEDIGRATEVILTGSVGGIRPASAFDGRKFLPVPGPITIALAKEFAQLLDRDDDLL